MDLCRQSLVYVDAAGVAACLAAVRADPEARVLRVKNRLDPADDARGSAGYRDVALNVRLETAAAVALGVDGHVCELQLLLRPYADIKVTRIGAGIPGAPRARSERLGCSRPGAVSLPPPVTTGVHPRTRARAYARAGPQNAHARAPAPR